MRNAMLLGLLVFGACSAGSHHTGTGNPMGDDVVDPDGGNSTDAPNTPGDRTAEFIGSWTPNAGAQAIIDCTDNSLDQTSQITQPLTISAGTSSDLQLDGGSGCQPVKFNVTGSVATLVSGQSCTSTSNGTTTTITYNSSMFTLSAAGDTLTIVLDANISSTGTSSIQCTEMASGTLHK